MGEAFITRRGGGTVGLKSISVMTPPTKTTYIAGESFNTAGMVVMADLGGVSIATSGYTVSPTVMVAGVTSVTITYEFAGVTKTANQSVTVITPSATLENNSWETIGLVADSGMASSFWNVGDEKTEVLNGVTYTFQIVGINHDNLATSDPRYGTSYNGGSNKAALTFALKECFTTSYRMNSSDTNEGGWDATEMRVTTLATTIYAYLEAALKNVVKTVNKLAAGNGYSATILTSADKLWLFSEIEVLGNNSKSKAGEGSQYAYWSAGNSRVKYQNGSVQYWLLRSPYSGNAAYFVYVSSSGSISSSGASAAGGVAFGFCV